MAHGQHSATDPNSQQSANVDAAWTLVRWIGIPLILVAALYFIERTYDERPYVVVTDHGTMPSPDQIVAAAPAPQSAAPAPTLGAPLVPSTPPPMAPQPSVPGEVLRPVERPSPPYPPRALDAEKEGIVRLRLTVAPDGHVVDAVVLRAEPRGWFERAAQDGVRRWRYAPSAMGGAADVDVEFKLK